MRMKHRSTVQVIYEFLEASSDSATPIQIMSHANIKNSYLKMADDLKSCGLVEIDGPKKKKVVTTTDMGREYMSMFSKMKEFLLRRSDESYMESYMRNIEPHMRVLKSCRPDLSEVRTISATGTNHYEFRSLVAESEKGGLIEVKEGEKKDGGRKRIYKPTPDGLEFLRMADELYGMIGSE